jgi:Cu+-exporting ATPase
MSIDSNKAAAKETYQGKVYYFCSADCQKKFKADPKKYAA